MVDIRMLKTVKRKESGAVWIEKQTLTREQAADLTNKIDWKDQTIVEGSKPCECKMTAGIKPNSPDATGKSKRSKIA